MYNNSTPWTVALGYKFSLDRENSRCFFQRQGKGVDIAKFSASEDDVEQIGYILLKF
jgi:hypothetical protein